MLEERPIGRQYSYCARRVGTTHMTSPYTVAFIGFGPTLKRWGRVDLGFGRSVGGQRDLCLPISKLENCREPLNRWKWSRTRSAAAIPLAQ
ncbi:hypothetical protein JZ751_003839 [Albula glossodonta]|uniref:Uncharacterized protein n=1 Tax=Albula glossodonta TaxID=121402 RepID=A0A8T2P318_9TELE|nr:hypothetical protein JZ751_003839 [Albula glossodonta]